MEHFNEGDKLEHKYVVASAVLSKLVSGAFTYPHEVIQSRQRDFRKYEKTARATKRSSLRFVFRQIA